jgi:predicted regulator of Ras-like GTPase activity (Roadblock/LC7/MglB family)
MTLQEIAESIMKKIPDIRHFMFFYEDGFIYYSNIHKEANIPKLSGSLEKIISQFKICSTTFGYKEDEVMNIIYESHQQCFLIIKLSKNHFIALDMVEKKKFLEIEEIKDELKQLRGFQV